MSESIIDIVEILPSDLQDDYKKIIDIKTERYNDELEEEGPEMDPSPELISWITDYIKLSENIFDTTESVFYKEGQRLNLSIRLLVYDEKIREFKILFEHFDIFAYPSLESFRLSFERIEPLISLDEFIEGYLVYAEKKGDTFYQNVLEKMNELFNKSQKKFSRQDYGDIDSWEQKVISWEKEEEKILEKIYNRQSDMILYSIHPDIKSVHQDENFSIKSRQLFFQCDQEVWNFSSIYDKFILSQATEEVPFIKVSILNGPKAGDEIYKIFTKVERDSINDWLLKNEKNSIEERRLEGGDDFIFFLIKLNEEKAQHASAFLNKKGMNISIPSSYSLDLIDNFCKRIVKDTFGIILFNSEEKSTKVMTYLSNFPHIQTSYLQFFLLSKQNQPFYMKEFQSKISSKRKIRLFSNPYSFFQREEYIVEYEVTNARKFTITGPSEKKCIFFFVNIFGRFIHSLILHQDAIHNLRSDLFDDLDNLDEKDEKKGKKKKKSSVLEPHLITKKKKSDYLQSILPALPEGYTKKYCQCHRQPIIFDEDEADAWIKSKETIFNQGEPESISKQKEVKKFLHNGKTFIFACPSNTHPEIRLTSSKAKNDEGQYILSPCCWEQKGKKKFEEPKNIVLPFSVGERGYFTEKEAHRGDRIVKIEQKSITENEKEAVSGNFSSVFLPAELKHFLQGMREGEYVVKNVSSGKEKNKSSLLECIIEALRLEKKSIRSYRNEIYENTNAPLLFQEGVTLHDPFRLHMDLKDPTKPLDSFFHYRALEEFFKIHIYVFLLEPHILSGKIEEGREYSSEDDFILEIPANKIFSAKTLYHDRPVVLLTKIKGTNEYGLIVDSSENKKGFFYSLSYPMMDMYTFFYETISHLHFQGKENSHIIKNFYSRINWENFFSECKIKIIAQEIDIAGKTRVLQLSNGAVIHVPPCQPFNVPLISDYTDFGETNCIQMFGEPDSWDEKGFWYSLFGIPNSVYVLTGPHNREKTKHILDDDREIPLNIFIPQNGGEDKILKKAWFEKKCANAIVQIIQWAWRYDGRQKFTSWFLPFVKIVPETSLENFYPNNNIIQNSLPDERKIRSVREGFKKINIWWPSVFSSDGKIKLTKPFFERLVQFFNREDDIMGGYTRDEIPSNLIGIYENAYDYPQYNNVRIFMNTHHFSNWARTERLQEENVEIYNAHLSLDTMSKKDSPVHFLYDEVKPLILQNNKTQEREAAVSLSYHWVKNKINLGALAEIEPISEEIQKEYKIVTISLTKDFSFLISEIEEGKTEKKLYIFRYPNGNYASVLEQ